MATLLFFPFFPVFALLLGFCFNEISGDGGNGGGASECTKITGVTDGHQR